MESMDKVRAARRNIVWLTSVGVLLTILAAVAQAYLRR